MTILIMQTLLDFFNNYDFDMHFYGSAFVQERVFDGFSVEDSFCPTCDNTTNLLDGKCPKVFTNPERIYVTRYHYYPYLNHFKNLDTLLDIVSRPRSSANLREVWSSTGSITNVCPKNLDDFLHPIKAIQIEFHPDSIIYKRYGLLIEKMTQFHKNTWDQSPFMGNGFATDIMNKYPEAQNSTVIRAIAEKEVMSFCKVQDELIAQIRVEFAFPELRLR